ncbi:hypothetical protein [Pseudocnuella soli]|uniref:hypothetical protein n=1 Tax=Pseudocnuella soli TaxID=2502779 RepID=UPI0014043409|nr:hypothetical protein [Pseudocnuella soli]
MANDFRGKWLRNDRCQCFYKCAAVPLLLLGAAFIKEIKKADTEPGSSAFEHAAGE